MRLRRSEVGGLCLLAGFCVSGMEASGSATAVELTHGMCVCVCVCVRAVKKCN
jgi:hypothetical protein